MKFIFISFFLLLVTGSTFSQETKDQFSVDVAAILKQISEPRFPEVDFRISTKSVKDTDWNDFINQQIEKCSKAGGGRVVLAKGRYFCEGPIILKSNVNLHLEKGSRMVFSQEPEDYLPVVLVRWEGTEAYNYSPFIYANNEENIAITGEGTIDGNGTADNSFRHWRPNQKKDQKRLREMGRKGVSVKERVFGQGSYLRPQLIHFLHCRNILIEGISVVDGSFWLIQPTYCDNITIRGVTVNSRFINNDGVDLDSDTHVLIEDCHFDTGDDFVAIKSGRDQDGWRINKSSKNIIIRNCVSSGALHGISFGSELSGGIENVYAENLTFKNIRSKGIQFKSNKDRGGYIRNVVIRNIRIDTVETAISFTNQYHGYSEGNSPTQFENILIDNLHCNVVTGKGISMVGLPEKPIRNVLLHNVSMNTTEEESEVSFVEDMRWKGVVID